MKKVEIRNRHISSGLDHCVDEALPRAALGPSLHLYKPQLLHLYNGNDNRTYLMGFLEDEPPYQVLGDEDLE